MKREICALALLLALFTGSVYNIHYIDRTIGALRDEAAAAFELSQNGEFERAQQKLKTASDRWLALDGYTHIFIRHTEIDSCTDAFFDMTSDLAAKDKESSVGSYKKLDAHLASLITIEHISLGSIF